MKSNICTTVSDDILELLKIVEMNKNRLYVIEEFTCFKMPTNLYILQETSISRFEILMIYRKRQCNNESR